MLLQYKYLRGAKIAVIKCFITGLDWTTGLPIEFKVQYYSSILVLTGAITRGVIERLNIKYTCSMEFTIYKPEYLRLMHTSAARGPTIMVQRIYHHVYTRVTMVASNETIIVVIAS